MYQHYCVIQMFEVVLNTGASVVTRSLLSRKSFIQNDKNAIHCSSLHSSFYPCCLQTERVFLRMLFVCLLVISFIISLPIVLHQITSDYNLRLPKLPAPASELKVKQGSTKDEITMENTKQLSAWSLCLPACRISESVQQLMELALGTLCEAVGSSTQWYVSVPGDSAVFCGSPTFLNEGGLKLISSVPVFFSAHYNSSLP